MSEIDPTAFDALIAQTGLTLTDAQTATLRAAYPKLQTMIARVTEPLPREAEPALIFQAEIR